MSLLYHHGGYKAIAHQVKYTDHHARLAETDRFPCATSPANSHFSENRHCQASSEWPRPPLEPLCHPLDKKARMAHLFPSNTDQMRPDRPHLQTKMTENDHLNRPDRSCTPRPAVL